MTHPQPPSWPNRAITGVRPGMRVWGYLPDLPFVDVIALIRNWGLWLEDSGCIRACHWDSAVEAEFRKRRFKTRPDTLTFRYRNAETTRASFVEVRQRFDSHKVPYSLELTPKRQQPRALRVLLNLDDVLIGQAAGNLLRLALGADRLEHLSIACAGQFRSKKDVPSVPLLHESTAFRAGLAIGRLTARVLRSGSD
jgi:hypothetical protein